MGIADFYRCLESYDEGNITPLTLWNFIEANRSAITADDITNLAQYASRLAEIRREGRTAIVFNEGVDFGPNTEERIKTARRFRSCMDAMGFQIRHFFDYEAAIEWLSD